MKERKKEKVIPLFFLRGSRGRGDAGTKKGKHIVAAKGGKRADPHQKKKIRSPRVPVSSLRRQVKGNEKSTCVVSR